MVIALAMVITKIFVIALPVEIHFWSLFEKGPIILYAIK